MRYLLFTAILVFCLAACNKPVKGKNGVTYKSAVQYNDYIVNRQTNLMKNVLDFSKIADANLDSAEIMLKKYVRQAEEMIDEIKGMPPYKGDSALRDAATRSFIFYKKIFENDYVDILTIRKKGADNITEEDVAEANRIVDKIGREEEVFDKAFHTAQNDYATKNKMKLMDNKVQKDIDKELNKKD